jgi:hypothetical protein
VTLSYSQVAPLVEDFSEVRSQDLNSPLWWREFRRLREGGPEPLLGSHR